MSKSYHKAVDRFESKSRAAAKRAKVPMSDVDRRAKRRASHWLKTGVSASTVEWMEERGML